MDLNACNSPSTTTVCKLLSRVPHCEGSSVTFCCLGFGSPPATCCTVFSRAAREPRTVGTPEQTARMITLLEDVNHHQRLRRGRQQSIGVPAQDVPRWAQAIPSIEEPRTTMIWEWTSCTTPKTTACTRHLCKSSGRKYPAAI